MSALCIHLMSLAEQYRLKADEKAVFTYFRDFKQFKKIELVLGEDTEEIQIGDFRLKIRHDAKNPTISLQTEDSKFLEPAFVFLKRVF